MTLVLSQEPASIPLDLKEVFKTYSTSKAASELVAVWVDSVRTVLSETSTRRNRRQGQLRSAKVLRNVSFGQNVAENERGEINEYLIETAPFQSALDGRAILYVGRKGTGKSANALAVEERLREERDILVCPIKPVGYMLDGLVATIRKLRTHAEEGFFIGSIWKYLIYTELAMAVEHDVNTRPPRLLVTEDERKLLQFIQQNRGYFIEDFGSRVRFGIEMTTASDDTTNTDAKVLKVSESLHSQLLARLRDLLKAATSAKERVAIIVDNLDKNWHANSDIDVLVDFLRGLIEVAERLQDELQTKPFGIKEPKYTLSIFLRSDIYATLRENTSEKDKLNGDILEWNDSEQLGRLLDERLEYYAKVEEASATWMDYFEAVGELSARSFILNSVLPRPRDAIFLTNEALDKAKNRGHSIVTSSDLSEALDSYSNWAFDSLLAEDHPNYGKLEPILYEFIGSTPRLAAQQVMGVLTRAGVSQNLQEYYLNLLLDTNFLGFVSPDGDKVFPSGEDRRRRQRRRHEKLYEARGSDMQYCIHPAFYPVLGI